ncbi:MAG: ZmpA/ZmpB/ZmpC family metallo-endopeptidase [Paeniclostridium sordellii]|nr:ZmpA/ZmpB/ZmpC family metallo-endopeptidase [Paeniclostridium sordellii]
MKRKKVIAIVSSMIIGVTGTVSSLPNTVYAEETQDTVMEKNLEQEVKNKKQTEDAQVEEKSIQRGENKYKLDHIYRNNNANGKEVSKQVKESLKSVKYEKNDVVANLLAPNRFSGVDKLNKKQEIAKRDNISIANVTDEQLEKELKEDNVHVMSYGQSFLDTQKDIEYIIQKLVENSTIEQGYTGDPNQYFIDKITKNKEKLLLGITYIDRLYDFNIGNKNIKEILTYTPNYYGKQIDPLDWLIRIGGSGGEMLKVSNNLKAFANLFKGVITDKDSLLSFLEDNKNRFAPNIKMEEWFKKASKAIIVEQPSQSNPNATTNLYSKLSSEIGLQAHILPLLTVSENSIYVITNSATITYGLVDSYVDRSLKESNNTLYQEKINQFKQQLEKAAKQQHDFIEFWYRLGKPKVHSLLSTNRLVIDSLRIYNSQAANPSKEWSPKFGDGAAIGVKEFITPLNLYANYFMADGQAEGSQVRLFLAKALDERGLCTYTHELTHLLVGTVWLNNNKQREGLEAEFYPRGLFETYELDEPVLNLNLIYDHNGKERFHNSSPERFKTDKDLQEYTSGLFDVLYTLDYAEANVILKKDKSDKQKWFHKLEQINDTRKRFNQGNSKATHKIDSIRKISTDEANELNTIYDLIDKNIITSRYEVEGLKTTGNVPSNGYYVVPLFSSNYAGVQNNNGVSGDVMMRRQAYELIAEYGYYDGLVPYLSNQYKAQADKDGKVLSDEYILGKIFEGKYATMTDFKKAMFNKRIDKKEQLKPVSIVWKNQKVTIDNFNKLNELMTDAIESDLKNVQELPTGWNNIRAQNTQVELLKKEIFKAYLKETDDFNKSIYRNDHKIIKHNKYINGYPDNTFRQENKITRGEMATMLTRIILDGKQVPITENKFNDISNDYWAKNEVNYLASKGLLNGYEDGTFRPENPITRAEVATILVRSNGDIKQKFKKIFPDIDDSHWANKYIEKAAELGYMLGYEDGSFKPDQVITRGETVVTLNRIYRNPCDLKETNNSKILFTDLDKNNWAYNDIVKAILSHEHVEK